MGRIKLKVCGMRDVLNIGDIAAIQPDYMGFIFYEKSPRYVGADFMMPASDFRGDTVGVFVNESLPGMIRGLKNIGSRIAQLHGHETPDDCEAMKDKGIKVIKAMSVGSDLDAAAVRKYAGVVDYFLFDTKGKLYGGNAVRFEWKLLERYEADIPFFLSGGIGVNDLGPISEISTPHLYAVDINSGVEISPGLKDAKKVKKAKEIVDKL